MTASKPRVKISIFHPFDIFGTKVGGIETVIKTFIKYAPADFDIELVGTTEDRAVRPVGRVRRLSIGANHFHNLPLIYEPAPNRRTPIPLTARFVASLAAHRVQREERILEFHRLEEAIPFRLRNNKRILFVHCCMDDVFGNPLAESKWRNFSRLYLGLERFLIPGMERIYSESGPVIEYYRRAYPRLRDRFCFLPTWADNDIFYPGSASEKPERKRRLRRQYGFPEDARLIFFTGRLEKQKNPLLLLRTFELVHSREKRARLVINGEGSLKQDMERYLEDAGLRRDAVLEWTPQEKMAEVMRLSDVFLLTSDFEGMPMSLLEALASGIPVVTTASGEARRVVTGDSGIVVESGTPEDLGGAVLEVLRHPERFGEAACLRAVQPYLPRAVLNPVYDYHYELAGEPARTIHPAAR